jgi:hypothetical protein
MPATQDNRSTIGSQSNSHRSLCQQKVRPGDYVLEVGLYDAESNVRLGESILLDQVIVIVP